ncbi:hypothetical protein AALC17_07535 [Oscillospiraceae bacterium 38-13]
MKKWTPFGDIMHAIGFFIGRGILIVFGFLAGYIGINFLMALATWYSRVLG